MARALVVGDRVMITQAALRQRASGDRYAWGARRGTILEFVCCDTVATVQWDDAPPHPSLADREAMLAWSTAHGARFNRGLLCRKGSVAAYDTVPG